jgi:hypothetical protein
MTGRAILPRSALASTAMLALISCSSGDNCVDMGEDVFQNMEALSGLARQLALPTSADEAAVIVGAAKAVSDLGDLNVRVCLRSGEGNETEFRILSVGDNSLDHWTTISQLMRR